MRLGILALFISLGVQGQNWELVKTVSLDNKITAISTDSKGMFYAGMADGTLTRLDQNGNEDLYFSEVNNSAVTSVQAWNQFKVFNFFRQQQSVVLLDRFNTSPKTIDMKDLGLRFAWLVAPGIDHSYWALSTEFRELIKYDENRLDVIFRIVLPQDLKIKNACYLRAFKNLLFIVDSKAGIYVFDQLGNYLGQIKETGIKHIEIKKGLIHTTNGSEYLVADPFSLKIVERTKAPDGAFWSVVTIGDKFIFFSEFAAHFYERR